MRAGSESSGGGEWGSREEGCEKAYRPQYSGRPSDTDLRWVPPWLSWLKNDRKRWFSVLLSEKMTVREARSWGWATALRILKVKPRTTSGALISRLFDLEVSNLIKIPTLPIIVYLGLRFRIGWTDLLPVDPHMLCIVLCSRMLILGVIWLSLCKWLPCYCSPLGRGHYKSYVQDISVRIDWVGKAFSWVSARLNDPCCIFREFDAINYKDYAWSWRLVCGGMEECFIDQQLLECAVDRQLGIVRLRLFSLSIYAIHYGSSVCLFSVMLNTVYC